LAKSKGGDDACQAGGTAIGFDLLLPPDLRKQNKVLKRFEDSGTHVERRRRIPFSNVIGYF
jgi:hypothetical protein